MQQQQQIKRLGFLEGQGHVTVDVDTFASAEIAAMFEDDACDTLSASPHDRTLYDSSMRPCRH